MTKLKAKNCILKSYNSLTMKHYDILPTSEQYDFSCFSDHWWYIGIHQSKVNSTQILTFVRRLKPYETKQWKRTSDGSWKWCTLQIFQLRKFLNTPGGQSPLYTKLMRMCPLSHFTIDQVLSHDVREVVSVIPLICLFTQTFSSIPAPVLPAIQTLW